MKNKPVMTAENVNAMIKYQAKQIEKVKEELTKKHKSEYDALKGGLLILEYTYKEALDEARANEARLRVENESLKKSVENLLVVVQKHEAFAIKQIENIKTLCDKSEQLAKDKIDLVEVFNRKLVSLDKLKVDCQ